MSFADVSAISHRGAGFIGATVVRHAIDVTEHNVVVVDKLTYAGNLESLAPVSSDLVSPSFGRTLPICQRCERSFKDFSQTS